MGYGAAHMLYGHRTFIVLGGGMPTITRTDIHQGQSEFIGGQIFESARVVNHGGFERPIKNFSPFKSYLIPFSRRYGS